MQIFERCDHYDFAFSLIHKYTFTSNVFPILITDTATACGARTNCSLETALSPQF